MREGMRERMYQNDKKTNKTISQNQLLIRARASMQRVYKK